MEKNADYWIEKMGLREHPDGGYTREVYRSEGMIHEISLPDAFKGSRRFGSTYYYLLKGDRVAKLHRIASDSIWFFHTGSPATIFSFRPSGTVISLRLGTDPEEGEMFQTIVQGGCYFGIKPDDEESFTLMSYATSPAQEMQDFEFAKAEELKPIYPNAHDIIDLLTGA